jgi:predicted Zn-dependent peptidase
VVVAVGAVDHHRVVDLAEASFDARQATISRPAPPMAATTASTTIAEHDGGQVHLLLGIHSPGAGSPDIVAAQVAAHALGGGVSSRLFRAIRDEAALAYSVGADVAATAEVGSLGVYCASAPANMGAVIDRIAAELDDLGRGGLTAAEFERSREAVRTDLLLSADEPLSRLGRLGYETLLLGGPTELAERVARLDALRFADVAEVAATLGTGLRHGVLVGPGTEGCRRQLEEACRL